MQCITLSFADINKPYVHRVISVQTISEWAYTFFLTCDKQEGVSLEREAVVSTVLTQSSSLRVFGHDFDGATSLVRI